MLTRFQYIFNNKNIGVTEITFSNSSPILNVEKIVYFTETGVTGNWLKKESRYSWDNVTWSPWVTLSQQNLINISFSNRENFYLEVKYTRANFYSADVGEFYLFYDSWVTTDADVPDASIDADFLSGKTAGYYLSRTNHVGAYTDLYIRNLPFQDASTNGVYSHQVDTATSTTFYLKAIGGTAGISVIDASDAYGNSILLIKPDASLGGGENLGGGDASILSKNIDGSDNSLIMQFRELKGSDNIVISVSENLVVFDSSGLLSTEYVDGSLALRDASIASKIENGANIGSGDASVFANKVGTDLRFRTIIGSGAATVTAGEDTITIGLDASFAGEVNSGLNVGSGAGIFKEKIGDNLVFKTLKSSIGNIVFSQDSSQVYIDASISDSSIYASVLFYDPCTLSESLTMPEDVGGIPAGTSVSDLTGQTITSLFNDLLFPTVNPTYMDPSSSFSDNVTYLQEIGDVISGTYTTSFSRGQILVSGVFQDYRSGLPSGYYFTDPSSNSLLVDASSSSLSNVQTIGGYVVTQGVQQWTAYVDYLAGPQPYDNKGSAYGTPLSAGSTSADTLSIEGVYPLFGTTVDISVLTQQSLVSMITGNNVSFSLVSEDGIYKQTFDIPKAWTTSRPLVSVQTYNTVSSSWEYEGGSAAASLTKWDDSSTSQTIQDISVGYTRYTYNSPDRSATQIRLNF